jgi:hypothetical protein
VPLSGALYESHYLTANDPAGGRALWLRHTSLKHPGRPAHPTVWLTWFDRAGPRPRAFRVTAPAPLADPGTAFADSALGRFGPDGASGAIEGAAWSLRWQGHAPELPYLPARWLYDRPVPRSGGVALIPSATVSGTLTLDGEPPLSLDGWDGMIGHNWGTEHAEQWTWAHGARLEPDGTGWFDLILVRVRIGPVLTPWLASGAVQWRGRTLEVARRGRVVREVAGERTRLAVPLAQGRRLELAITAPEAATASWDYSSPGGRGRDVRNCSVADATLSVISAGSTETGELEGRVAVEHGGPAA